MTDYTPLFKPGQAVTRQASADVTGGQLVVVTGNKTVGPAGAAAVNWVGVAAFDAKAGQDVTIYSGGVQRPVASGTINAGDQVTTAANGRVITAATPAVGALVGVAGSTAADGATVEIHFVR